MKVRDYKINRGSMHEQALASRAKIQLIGGGFANGKTALACIKALQVALDYPGASILIARATYPKLNDTIRKEFLKWCPNEWVSSFVKNDNTITMVNGTTINFRYIAQQSNASGSETTSNLLSATYDLIVIDQIDDAEFTFKDIQDLLGRLRGNAVYVGDDATMPKTGPRWMILMTNPTGGWVYHRLVKPLYDYRRGIANDNLMCWPDGTPLIELYEASTYENADNLGADFIETLEGTYRGQMRDRYLLGKWVAYEGAVFPDFDPVRNILTAAQCQAYYDHLVNAGYVPEPLEGYDWGRAVPSAYINGFTDHRGNVFIVDGFYAPELNVEDMALDMKRIRRRWRQDPDRELHSDPSIFRRGAASTKALVGASIADLFASEGISCVRGNNDILNGIIKITTYLSPDRMHRHPLTDQYDQTAGHSRLYISDSLQWLAEEFGDYRWKQNKVDDGYVDEPIDKKNHALDALRYALSRRPHIARIAKQPMQLQPWWSKWHEQEPRNDNKDHRHGRRRTA